MRKSDRAGLSSRASKSPLARLKKLATLAKSSTERRDTVSTLHRSPDGQYYEVLTVFARFSESAKVREAIRPVNAKTAKMTLACHQQLRAQLREDGL